MTSTTAPLHTLPVLVYKARTTSLVSTQHFDNERVMAVKSLTVPCVDESSLPDPSQPQADFLDTSFFQSTSGETYELPSPASVLEKDARGGGRGTVAIPELNLLVKFDQAAYLRFDEAVTLRAIHAFPNGEIPVPELFGWRTHGSMKFIYMSLMEGKTLRVAWPSLTEPDKAGICEQLSRIIASLQSIKRASEDHWIGKSDIFQLEDLVSSVLSPVPRFNHWRPYHGQILRPGQ